MWRYRQCLELLRRVTCRYFRWSKTRSSRDPTCTRVAKSGMWRTDRWFHQKKLRELAWFSRRDKRHTQDTNTATTINRVYYKREVEGTNIKLRRPLRMSGKQARWTNKKTVLQYCIERSRCASVQTKQEIETNIEAQQKIHGMHNRRPHNRTQTQTDAHRRDDRRARTQTMLYYTIRYYTAL